MTSTAGPGRAATLAAPSVYPLDGSGWSCKGYVGEEWLLRRAFAPDTRDVHGWIPARVPGSVVDDLVRAGEVDDPKFDRHSRDCEWVATRTWVYRRAVELEVVPLRAELQFDGIDHAARVYVNGVEVGDHVGAFTPAAFDVAHALRPGTNLVAVVVAPAPDGQPHIGRTDRVRTLKSRMTYGWDFCPRLVHVGIWDHARLVVPGPVRITDLWVRAEPVGERGGALHWRAEIVTEAPGHVDVEVELRRDDAAVTSQRRRVAVDGGRTHAAGTISLDEVERWWPNGSGGQPLYDVGAEVALDGDRDTARVTTGFRRVRLVANEGAPADARGYTLEVNGRRVYVQGWNWVPMDVHHGVEDPELLEHLLGLAARAGTNLLRVWGGGLVEKTAFYALCDRLGLLVWQEFPLSSSMHGSVPADDADFVAAVVADARRIVPRRRNHPSLALWCGGNELDDEDGRPADGRQPVLDALREVVADLDPDRPWLPTSPTGPVATLTDAALDERPDDLHDVHGPWEHQGPRAHRRLYDRSTALFHSEFGVEGMADVATIETHLSPDRRWPADRSNPDVVHRGDFWVNTPMLREVFGDLAGLSEQVAASQFLQADGLRYALEANRRRQWRQSGSIPWQFNEPFPNVFCTSAVDHSGRPKPAYYAVAAAYRPLLVAASAPTQVWAGHDEVAADVWVNSRAEDLQRAVVEAALRAADGSVLGRERFELDVNGAATTAVGEVRWSVPTGHALFWLDLALLDGRDHRAGNRYLFARDDDLRAMRTLPAADLQVERADDGRRVTIRNVGDHVAIAVTVRDGRAVRAPGHLWCASGDLTLFPGEVHVVEVGWSAGIDRPAVVVGAWNTRGRYVA